MTLPALVLGFATYEKRTDAPTELLIEACMKWREEFLLKQDGVMAHWFFTNTKGQFADAMIVASPQAMEDMMATCETHPATHEFIGLLKPESIKLNSSNLLTYLSDIPKSFTCLEYASFESIKPKDDMIEASLEVSDGYLAPLDDVESNVLTQKTDNNYAEVTFYRTLGAAQRICQGYINHPACENLLSQCDPDKVQIDFWTLLA